MPSIIDSHVHFWDPEQLRYAWLDDKPLLNRAYLTDHVPSSVDGVHVEGIVFVQADCAPAQALAEADFVTGLAAQDKRVRGIVAFADMTQPEQLPDYLAELQKRPLVRGVRHLIQGEPLGFCTQPDFLASVQQLPTYGFSFDLCIYHPQLPDVTQLVKTCPEVSFVLDHIGKPDILHQLLDPWREQISELAALPNVSCKLSGLVTEADMAAWTEEDLQPYIAHVLSAFGPDRVMFGSDAPVEYLASTYERWVQTLQNATQTLSDTDKEKLWHKNAAAFYRL